MVGTAIGAGSASTIANLFMKKIDKILKAKGYREALCLIEFMKRFIDDIFMLWSGTRDEFEAFMVNINTMHKTLKFTCQYDFERKSTTFLDMEVKMVNGKIVTDLFRKKWSRLIQPFENRTLAAILFGFRMIGTEPSDYGPSKYQTCSVFEPPLYSCN